jgi:hypothetical protein
MYLNNVGIFIDQAVNGFLYEMFHKWKQTGTIHYLAEYFFLFLLILLIHLILQSMYPTHAADLDVPFFLLFSKCFPPASALYAFQPRQLSLEISAICTIFIATGTLS